MTAPQRDIRVALAGRAALLLPLSVLALGAATPICAAAQVGHPPTTSPFVDLEWRQGASAFAGWFAAGRDPAGVAPQGGPMVGVRYDVGLGGPAIFTGRIASVVSERTVLDPARPAGARVLGTEQRPLTIADLGISLALTGQKSYRRLVPVVYGGVGVASNFASADPGGFRFGTRFAIATAAGVRYVPGGRWALRADLGTHLYQVRYPDIYGAPGLDSTSVLAPGRSTRAWIGNPSLTVGATYQLFR